MEQLDEDFLLGGRNTLREQKALHGGTGKALALGRALLLSPRGGGSEQWGQVFCYFYRE